MKQRFVVVDIETTGNSPKKGDRIIQLAAVVVENEQIVDQYTTFVNPCVPIPAFIEELTGINDEMVKDAPLFEKIAPRLLEMLDHSIFVAHNVLFDLNFIQSELNRVGYSNFTGQSIDTVELARVLFPSSESFKLFELTESFSINHERPHQADSDAFVTAELLLHFINRTRQLPLVTLEKLSVLSIELKSDIEIVFESVLHEKKNHVENLPNHLEVFRGIALKKKRKKQISHDYREKIEYPLSNDEKEKIISANIQQFESRYGQYEMMDTVYEAFRLQKHAIIEAGTGVGKSLGYLLPSIYFSKSENKPILISTYTVQLQEQLLQKEVKNLSKMFQIPFKTVLLKGRQHYLNLFKFEQTLCEADAQYDSVMTKMQILVWLTDTETGDIDEINLSSGGKLFWNRIKHDGWHLSKERDPWVSKDFYLYARREAENADLVITNHAMLLNDLVQDQQLFQSYDYVIIDEAHHFEKAARNFFGEKLNYIPSKFLCSKIGSLNNKQLFFQLEKLVETKKLQVHIPAFELDFSIVELERNVDDLFLGLAEKLVDHQKKSNKNYQKIQIHLSNQWMNESNWKPVIYCAERIAQNIKEIIAGITERLDNLNKISEKLTEIEKALIEEVYSLLNELIILDQSMHLLMLNQSDGYVYWLEGDSRAIPNSVSIQAQPISIRDQLINDFFSKRNSVVLTSATLTVNNSFSYIENELGLYVFENRIKKQISSPFRYNELTRLIIPNDVPEIGQVSLSEYAEAIAGHLIAIAQATKGRMLVLFTSFELLRKTYDLMKESGLLDEFILIAQGISTGSRTRLTKNFQRFDKAILFGTNSFWEGIDIPGEDLSCLAIIRLPFSPPDEPYSWAKSEALKAEGKNSFSAYSLPEAVIRFKQGFGRLIRKNTDKGIIIVFDRRIETTKYGSTFIRSIPPIPIDHAPLNKIIEIVDEWL
ncbi:ATP-dependent DNA helicase DinG [Heyndrickxia sp. NPDC080065]|uniref:ATP-dependent DNA helicase DinG n=1 Tax=Heyndrickxia sp. NPDC080065 TaxID=3390568 RepID=UPI003D03F4B6